MSVITGVYFSQTSVIYFFLGFSCCLYYPYGRVSARQEFTVLPLLSISRQHLTSNQLICKKLSYSVWISIFQRFELFKIFSEHSLIPFTFLLGTYIAFAMHLLPVDKLETGSTLTVEKEVNFGGYQSPPLPPAQHPTKGPLLSGS